MTTTTMTTTTTTTWWDKKLYFHFSYWFLVLVIFRETNKTVRSLPFPTTVFLRFRFQGICKVYNCLQIWSFFPAAGTISYRFQHHKFGQQKINCKNCQKKCHPNCLTVLFRCPTKKNSSNKNKNKNKNENKNKNKNSCLFVC